MSPERYRRLKSAGAKVACRRNGCERLVGKDPLELASSKQIVLLPGVRSAIGVLGKNKSIHKMKIHRSYASDYYGE